MEKFDGSHNDAKSTIESAFVHVQTYYCHMSLGAQLKLDRIGDIMHINDSFPTHELYSSKVLAITNQNIGTADLMVYINGASSGGILGVAGCLGCVCDIEIGDSLSRNWQVYKIQYWGRHNANYWTGNSLELAYVSSSVII